MNNIKKKYLFITFFLVIFQLSLILFWPNSAFLVSLPQNICPRIHNIYEYDLLSCSEYSIAEILQALSYLLAFIFSIRSYLKNKSKRVALGILSFSLFILFAEETSWLQHYFDYSIPSIEILNNQEEVNIHNLFFLQGGSLRSNNINLFILFKAQNLFRLSFITFFYILPLLSINKIFKKYFKKYNLYKPSNLLIANLSICLIINLLLAFNSETPSLVLTNPSLANPIAECRELIYALFILLYSFELFEKISIKGRKLKK